MKNTKKKVIKIVLCFFLTLVLGSFLFYPFLHYIILNQLINDPYFKSYSLIYVLTFSILYFLNYSLSDLNSFKVIYSIYYKEATPLPAKTEIKASLTSIFLFVGVWLSLYETLTTIGLPSIVGLYVSSVIFPIHGFYKVLSK